MQRTTLHYVVTKLKTFGEFGHHKSLQVSHKSCKGSGSSHGSDDTSPSDKHPPMTSMC
jgi:hypothetical protein